MKRIFLPLFIIFIFNFANAEESKKDKKYENMTEEQLLAEFMKTDKELEKEKEKSKELAKLRKTVDEIKNKLAIDKK